MLEVSITPNLSSSVVKTEFKLSHIWGLKIQHKLVMAVMDNQAKLACFFTTSTLSRPYCSMVFVVSYYTLSIGE